MENGNPEIKNGNPVYLGVPLLFRRLLKNGGGVYYYQVNIILIDKCTVNFFSVFWTPTQNIPKTQLLQETPWQLNLEALEVGAGEGALPRLLKSLAERGAAKTKQLSKGIEKSWMTNIKQKRAEQKHTVQKPKHSIVMSRYVKSFRVFCWSRCLSSGSLSDLSDASVLRRQTYPGLPAE